MGERLCSFALLSSGSGALGLVLGVEVRGFATELLRHFLTEGYLCTAEAEVALIELRLFFFAFLSGRLRTLCH